MLFFLNDCDHLHSTSVLIVAGLLGFAVGLLNVLEHSHASVGELPDVGNVVVLGDFK